MKIAATYSTGKPCKNGHPPLRYVATGKCTLCMAGSRRRHYLRYPEKCNEQRKQWRLANPRKFKERWRIHKTVNKEKIKVQARKRVGLPEPTRPEPVVCEKCSRPTHDGRAMALDHCKLTHTFRGWLCFKCNTGIGHLGDTEEGVLEALNYLRLSNGKERLSV